MVKNLFITFSHKDIGTVRLPYIGKRLAKLLEMTQKCQIWGVEELHLNGKKHYHFIVKLLGKGVSKHTYRKDIRFIFPEITGMGLDVRGIRNKVRTSQYLIKSVADIKQVWMHNSSIADLYKLGKMTEMIIWDSMAEFKGTLEEWKDRSLVNRRVYLKNPTKASLIWDDCRAGEVLNITKAVKYIELEQFNSWQGTENVLDYNTVAFLLKVVSLLFIKFDLTKHWKRTNLMLIGSPNMGKTSFFKKLERTFNSSFCWCAPRKGDLTSFTEKNLAIVIDDILHGGNKWPISTLIKLSGSEGFLGDRKIKNMVNIPEGIPLVIITNFRDMFIDSKAIRVRLCRVQITSPVNWLSIDDTTFVRLINLFKDIVEANISESLLNELLYAKWLDATKIETSINNSTTTYKLHDEIDIFIGNITAMFEGRSILTDLKHNIGVKANILKNISSEVNKDRK